MLRRKAQQFEQSVALIGADGWLLIRSSDVAADIPADGSWRSPVWVNGASLRKLVPKLPGPMVTLTYSTGRLFLDQTSVPAAEGGPLAPPIKEIDPGEPLLL